MDQTTITKAFKSLFSIEPHLVRSPGRVNLIGEHTDYNNGFVLPAAIDKDIVFAIAKNNDSDRRCQVHALDVDEHISFDPGDFGKSEKGWANYVLGVVDQLQQRGHAIGGFNCVFGGDIPQGSGMSSSAALECGIAAGLNAVFGLGVDKIDLVKLSQKAENEFVGMNCGIMDQFASVFGKDRQALKLDCRSLEYQYYPADIAGHKIVLFNSGVKHALVDSEYNVRRSQCEEGVAALQNAGEAVESLRDATLPMLDKQRDRLDPVVYQRCRYVVKENQRVEEACRALESQDLTTFGQKLYESQQGMQHEYEITVPEIDFLVDQTRDEPRVLGGRMMGGGFGGCTINLMEESAIESFSDQLAQAYRDKFSIDLEVYIADIVDGTQVRAPEAGGWE